MVKRELIWAIISVVLILLAYFIPYTFSFECCKMVWQLFILGGTRFGDNWS